VHASVAVPGIPAAELSSSGYSAALPLLTVALVAPFTASEKSTPIPASGTTGAGPGAFVIAETVPVRAPPTVGAKTTWNAHDPPGATVAVQAFLAAGTLKSPVTTIPATTSGEPPLFASVIACGADTVVTPVAPNVSPASGDSVTPGGATPVPFNATVCVLNSSDTVSVPLPGPTLFGTDTTEIAQLACPISELPHALEAAKSPLVTSAEISVSALSPVFVNVTTCAALVVFNCCGANVSASGLSPSVAALAPTPVSAAVCVPTESVTVSTPVRFPETVGVNTIPTVHPVCDASELSQVFVLTVKSPLIETP
jgi:hypothetical protein